MYLCRRRVEKSKRLRYNVPALDSLPEYRLIERPELVFSAFVGLLQVVGFVTLCYGFAEFLPLHRERYERRILPQYWNDPVVQTWLVIVSAGLACLVHCAVSFLYWAPIIVVGNFLASFNTYFLSGLMYRWSLARSRLITPGVSTMVCGLGSEIYCEAIDAMWLGFILLVVSNILSVFTYIWIKRTSPYAEQLPLLRRWLMYPQTSA